MASSFRASSVLFVVAVVLSACGAGGGGGGGATLRALNVRSGKVRWTEPIGTDSAVAVAAAAGTVVVEEGRCDAAATSVVALDSETGQQRWRVGGIANGYGGLGVGDNVVAVREPQQKLVGIDVTSGSVRWTVDGPPGDDAHGAPIVVDTADLVLVRTAGTLTALDRATGGLRWRSTLTGGEVVGVSADETHCCGDGVRFGKRPAANVIAAYDLADGRQRWRLYVPVWDHLAGPALTNDGVTVYTGGSIRRDQAPTSGMVDLEVSTGYDTRHWPASCGPPTPTVGRTPALESVTATSTSPPTTRSSRSTPTRAASAGAIRRQILSSSPPATVWCSLTSNDAGASDSEVLAADTGAVRWHGTLGGPGATTGDTIFAASGGTGGQCAD